MRPEYRAGLNALAPDDIRFETACKSAGITPGSRWWSMAKQKGLGEAIVQRRKSQKADKKKGRR